MVCTSHVTIWYASTCSMFCIWIWVNMNALYVRFSYSFRDVRRYDKLVKNLFCVVFESCQHSCNRFSSELNKLKTNAKRTKVKWKTILNTFIVGAVFFACFRLLWTNAGKITCVNFVWTKLSLCSYPLSSQLQFSTRTFLYHWFCNRLWFNFCCLHLLSLFLLQSIECVGFFRLSLLLLLIYSMLLLLLLFNFHCCFWWRCFRCRSRPLTVLKVIFFTCSLLLFRSRKQWKFFAKV